MKLETIGLIAGLVFSLVMCTLASADPVWLIVWVAVAALALLSTRIR